MASSVLQGQLTASLGDFYFFLNHVPFFHGLNYFFPSCVTFVYSFRADVDQWAETVTSHVPAARPGSLVGPPAWRDPRTKSHSRPTPRFPRGLETLESHIFFVNLFKPSGHVVLLKSRLVEATNERNDLILPKKLLVTKTRHDSNKITLIKLSILTQNREKNVAGFLQLRKRKGPKAKLTILKNVCNALPQ